METSIVNTPCYSGKVRELYEYQDNFLVLEASDRLSAFNRHQCYIEHKGQFLNEMSAWWFNKTKQIIPNHYLWHKGKYMMVKKTKPIKLEFVVRGYITGSLWKQYSSGERNIYGITFPDGLIKDQNIIPILTPTHKNDNDDPTTEAEILKMNILTEEELAYLKDVSMKLFQLGTEISAEMGLTLVDTKYEFGRDLNGKLILIDEVHTCDSSRYWSDNKHLDKQVIRDWIEQNPDKEINGEIKTIIYNIYKSYATLLNPNIIEIDLGMNEFLVEFKKRFDRFVCIIAGSTTDKDHVEMIAKYLEEFGFNYDVCYSSAHKQTQNVVNYIKEQDAMDRNMVWITVAGRSNALSGVVAANSRYPVFACPPFKDKVDMMVNINSTLQMPSDVPVALILEPRNLALFIKRIFN